MQLGAFSISLAMGSAQHWLTLKNGDHAIDHLGQLLARLENGEGPR